MNMENKGFAAYTEKEKMIEEEVVVGKALQELSVLLPSTRLKSLPSVEKISMGGEEVMSWVKPFIGHPERMVWLKGFIEESKKEMRAVVPEGESLDVLASEEKWIKFFRAHITDEISGKVWEAARSISIRFKSQVGAFKSEDEKAGKI